MKVVEIPKNNNNNKITLVKMSKTLYVNNLKKDINI